MPSKSKNKGSSFEREIATFLSDLYSDSFTRVPNSGAFTGGKNSYRREGLTEGQVRSHKGDIVPPDNWKWFNCEAKSYKEFPFHQLLLSDKVILFESWAEQSLEAADSGDFSTIFMKFNRKGKYIAYQIPKGSIFKTHRHIDYTDQQGNIWRITGMDNFFVLNKNEFKNLHTS